MRLSFAYVSCVCVDLTTIEDGMKIERIDALLFLNHGNVEIESTNKKARVTATAQLVP